MKAIIILTITVLDMVTSFLPIRQAIVAPFAPPPDDQFGVPQVGNGLDGLHFNTNPNNHGQLNSFTHTPTTQPCSHRCTFHFQNGTPG